MSRRVALSLLVLACAIAVAASQSVTGVSSQSLAQVNGFKGTWCQYRNEEGVDLPKANVTYAVATSSEELGLRIFSASAKAAGDYSASDYLRLVQTGSNENHIDEYKNWGRAQICIFDITSDAYLISCSKDVLGARPASFTKAAGATIIRGYRGVCTDTTSLDQDAESFQKAWCQTDNVNNVQVTSVGASYQAFTTNIIMGNIFYSTNRVSTGDYYKLTNYTTLPKRAQKFMDNKVVANCIYEVGTGAFSLSCHPRTYPRNFSPAADTSVSFGVSGECYTSIEMETDAKGLSGQWCHASYENGAVKKNYTQVWTNMVTSALGVRVFATGTEDSGAYFRLVDPKIYPKSMDFYESYAKTALCIYQYYPGLSLIHI